MDITWFASTTTITSCSCKNGCSESEWEPISKPYKQALQRHFSFLCPGWNCWISLKFGFGTMHCKRLLQCSLRSQVPESHSLRIMRLKDFRHIAGFLLLGLAVICQVMHWCHSYSCTTTSEAWYMMVKGYYDTPSTLGYQPVILLLLAVT